MLGSDCLFKIWGRIYESMSDTVPTLMQYVYKRLGLVRRFFDDNQSNDVLFFHTRLR